MKNEILLFIIAFTSGLIWFRILFFIIPNYFKNPFVRTTTKLRWHHLHFGIILIMIGAIAFLFKARNTTVSVLLGVGLGLILDLFIPSVQLETDREKELIIYRNSLMPTLYLWVSIVILIIILTFFIK